ncbi:hypothetical protein GGR57DRAFT_449318 [Xylariaceae sp. FL1272]|nr:hypothetical protein GGR57DRAFT_449318 [Xylariaceae sp. FL1272]
MTKSAHYTICSTTYPDARRHCVELWNLIWFSLNSAGATVESVLEIVEYRWSPTGFDQEVMSLSDKDVLGRFIESGRDVLQKCERILSVNIIENDSKFCTQLFQLLQEFPIAPLFGVNGDSRANQGRCWWPGGRIFSINHLRITTFKVIDEYHIRGIIGRSLTGRLL